ncbi:MAG: anhydro-N-acetylmuramic acid kinase [Ktedonobacterales bacterium]
MTTHSSTYYAVPMRVVGVLSGTSVDAIDTAICEFEPESVDTPGVLRLRLRAFQEHPYPPALRERLLALFTEQHATLEALTEINFLLGAAFAEAVLRTCADSGYTTDEIDLIASHGQTIYHLVAPDHMPSTLQFGEPSIIAQRTGATVVADFRVADMAAGGQGAPLVSLLDALLFTSPHQTRALQNIGGIGNVTFLPAARGIEGATAFDTGPGNVLIDYGARWFSHGKLAYDRDGHMAGAGRPDGALVAETLAHPYFHQPPPKTTGRELFGDAFAADLIQRALAKGLTAQAVMATVTAITAQSIAAAYRDFGPPTLDAVIVSGGGARNPVLLEGLRRALPGTPVNLYDTFGLPAEAKEAVLFALLGYETIHGRPGNLPGCTGARMPVTLGKIIPATNTGMLYARLMRAAATNYPQETAPTPQDSPAIETIMRSPWPSPRTQRIHLVP